MVKGNAAPMEQNVLGPDQGSHRIFAAWDMFYWIFGFRADRIDITRDGVFFINLRAGEGYDIDRILKDISHANHRIDLIPSYFWLNDVPDRPTDSGAISVFGSAWFGNARNGGKKKTTDYMREASKIYRQKYGISDSGAKKSDVLKINKGLLAQVDPSIFSDVPPEDLAAFRLVIDQYADQRAAAV